MSLPRVVLALAVVLTMAGCADSVEESGVATDAPEPAVEPSGGTPDEPPATTAASTTTAPATTPPTTAPPPTAPPTTDAPACSVLDDPMEDQPTGWLVVNDGVMGGRSIGQVALSGDVLVFDGEIVTDGGGFSSIRTDLADGALESVTRIVVRARPDGRDYLLTARDVAPDRGRRTSFQAAIPFDDEPGAQEVEILIDDLAAVVFGQSVEAPPFEQELAVEIGIQLSDGVDGPFRLELDALLVCQD